MIYAFLADGFEEVEALAVVDILRRAKIEAVMVSITDELVVTGSHGIEIKADINISNINFNDGNAIFLPGGLKGTQNLLECEKLREQILKYNAEGKIVSAICAAPSILGELGILNGKKAICYPGFEDKLKGAYILNEPVVEDGNIITSKGMGTAMDMGLKLAEILADKETAVHVGQSIQYL